MVKKIIFVILISITQNFLYPQNEKQRKEIEQAKAGKVRRAKNEISKLIPFNRKNQAYA